LCVFLSFLSLGCTIDQCCEHGYYVAEGVTGVTNAGKICAFSFVCVADDLGSDWSRNVERAERHQLHGQAVSTAINGCGKSEMSEGGSVDRAELIKWWDALDTLTGTEWRKRSVKNGLEMARESAHPDAQWLVSLFPAGAPVTTGHLRKMLLEQGEDPRALYLILSLGDTSPSVAGLM
jgi:hypothetical protein